MVLCTMHVLAVMVLQPEIHHKATQTGLEPCFGRYLD